MPAPTEPRARHGRRVLALLIGALLAVAPGAVAAHDDLRSATPGDGETLSVVPDALRLLFTRQQNLALASVRLVGPDGEIALGEMRAHPDSAALVVVPVVGPWKAGEHRVRWRIVGADGHPVSGEYRFVVAESARGLPPERPAEIGASGAEAPAPGGPSEPDQAESASGEPFTVSSPLYVLIRWVGFMALLGLLGSASWTLLVVPLARRNSGAGVAVGGDAAEVGLAAAALLLLAGLGRLWAQATALGVGETAPAGVLGTVLGSTAWGAGWWLQMVGGTLAATGLMWARRARERLPWMLVGVSAIAVAFAPSLSGHAMGVEPLRGVAVLVDGVHVLAAGGWMGGLLLLLAVGLPPALRDGEGRRSLAPLVGAFSLTALGFATALVLTGLVSSWLHLGSLEALWSSGYGRTLGLKLLLLVPLFATGAYNWLRVRPTLASGDAPACLLRRSGGVELSVAAAVILVTAALVATTPPSDAGPRVAGSSSPTQEVPSP